MRKRVVGMVMIAALLALTVGCGGQGGGASQTSAKTAQSEEVSIHTGENEPVRVGVEIADNPAERSRGLMYRTSLAGDRGMLFVFGGEQELSFWMKNTKIPLSIAYIDSEGRIVDIQDMAPMSTESHRSAEPARYALEVNQGFFEEHGVEVGDRVELPTR